MSRFLSRSISVLATRLIVTGFVALALSATASAAPPPGMRWSDHAWGRSKSSTSTYDARPRGSAPATGTPPFRYVAPYRVAPSQTIPSSGPGVWVRGADGVYRWYPSPVIGFIR